MFIRKTGCAPKDAPCKNPHTINKAGSSPTGTSCFFSMNGTPERPQMLRRIEMIDLPAKRRLLHKYCAAASFLVQMNRQKPSQQPSRKKSNTLPSTGSHGRLHKVVSHRWMFCLGQVPTQASQAMHSPLPWGRGTDRRTGAAPPYPAK